MLTLVSSTLTRAWAWGPPHRHQPCNLGIIDFNVPEGSSNGKAIHVSVNADIADLSVYGIGVANNGGGTDGVEYIFPAEPASAGGPDFRGAVARGQDRLLRRLHHFSAVYLDDGSSNINGSSPGIGQMEMMPLNFYMNDGTDWNAIELFGELT